jgi:O-6-methylguanine DNA methyltransferase
MKSANKSWTSFVKDWQSKTLDGEENVYIDQLVTPVGPLILGCTDKGVCIVEFYSLKKLEKNLIDMQKRRPIKVVLGESKLMKSLKKELESYFQKELKDFSLPLDLIGTDFQKKVWQILSQIPFGETISYSDQAKIYGAPKSLRAVASANGKNKISIILPCHRVIGKNGDLTGYAGGLDKKSWLLDFERG